MASDGFFSKALFKSFTASDADFTFSGLKDEEVFFSPLLFSSIHALGSHLTE